MAETMRQRPPPSWLSCAPSPPTISHRLGRLLVGCCVPPSSGSHQNLRPRCSLYFYFLFAQFAAPNNGWTSSPHVPHRLHLLFNAPPAAAADLRLVVVFPHRVAATQGRCSAHLSFFWWVPFRLPNQGNQLQRAWTQPPGACNRLVGSRGAAILVYGRCCHGERGQSRWG